MLLTIGMIVKNEEKYLRKCLEALQPILKNVSSELIIVDTGSTDSTVEIAKEFTDKVLYFEWIKDFSAARNFGMSHAQGEWFMSVDADEIFLSCGDIISFFNSGEYKDYNSAAFSVRNFSDLENRNAYTEFYVPRLTKLLPETKYVNPVHEKLNTYGHPIRVLTDTAEHFGYSFIKDSELREKKFTRNMELLKARLETPEKDTNPSLYKELMDTFCMQDISIIRENLSTIEEYAHKGIEICQKQKNDYILSLYHNLMTVYMYLDRFEDAVKLHDEYFAVDDEIRKGVRTTDMDILGFTANALFALNRYDEACEKYEKFFQLYDAVKNHNFCTKDALYTIRHLSNGRSFDSVCVNYTSCCLNTEKYKEAEQSFRNHPSSAYKYDKSLYFNRVRQQIFLLSKYDIKEIIRIYSGSDEKFKKELFDSLRFSILSADDAKRRALINKLSSLSLKNSEQRSLISLYKAHFTGNGAGAERTSSLIEKIGADHPDVLYIMLDEGLDITPFVTACADMNSVIETAYGCIGKFHEKLINYSADNIKASAGIHGAARMYLSAAIESAKRKLNAEKILETLGNTGMKYLQVYGESSIPEEVYAAVTIAEINLLRSCRNFKGCIETLRRLIKLNKRYAPIASEYQNYIKADMQHA